MNVDSFHYLGHKLHDLAGKYASDHLDWFHQRMAAVFGNLALHVEIGTLQTALTEVKRRFGCPTWEKAPSSLLIERTPVLEDIGHLLMQARLSHQEETRVFTEVLRDLKFALEDEDQELVLRFEKAVLLTLPEVRKAA